MVIFADRLLLRLVPPIFEGDHGSFCYVLVLFRNFGFDIVSECLCGLTTARHRVKLKQKLKAWQDRLSKRK